MIKYLTPNFLIILILLLTNFVSLETAMSQSSQDNATIATQWLLDAVGDSGKAAVEAVYMIYSPKTKSKGSGFLLANGIIITNEHVVRECQPGEVFARSSRNVQVPIKQLIIDNSRDLAALVPNQSLNGGLKLGDDQGIQVGQLVLTYGYPLGYDGPAPLLSVGYLSGFQPYKPDPNSNRVVRHLVVNGAFNAGNSGGPLFLHNSKSVIGVVVNKALPPFTPFVQAAINAFASNQSGIVYNGTDDQGKPMSMVESQVLAEVVKSLREMSQVMIGEAISVAELKAFLTDNNLPQP